MTVARGAGASLMWFGCFYVFGGGQIQTLLLKISVKKPETMSFKALCTLLFKSEIVQPLVIFKR